MSSPIPADIAVLVEKALTDALQERGMVNILIAGRSGVGKSTLINAVFQGNLAETGQGRPITQTTREITKEGVPLTLFDTRGLELAAFADTLAPLEALVVSRSGERDPARHIHVAWLCVQEDGRRVEQAEIELHEMLSRHMPVIAIVTKARSDAGFRDEVQRLLPKARSVVRVRAMGEQLDDGHSLPPYNLQSLIECTAACIPEGRRRAFAAAQKASIEYKREVSHGIVLGAATTAALTGATPIPIADAAVLVPVQVAMLAGISAAFGLELTKAFLGTLVATATGSLGATVAGRVIVANLLKLIPGAGTIAGAVVSGATAAALTTALGEAYIAALAKVLAVTAGEPPSSDAIVDALKSELGAKRGS